VLGRTRHWMSGSLGLLAVFVFGCASAAKTQQAIAPHTYLANFQVSYWRGEASAAHLYLPLWVETPPSREIEHSPVDGIQIERVEVDGRTIPAMDVLIQWGPRPPPLRLDAPFFVYVIEADAWNYRLSGDDKEKPNYETDYELVNVRRDTENEYEQVVYRIPYDAQRIKIEYRPRYPVGERKELAPFSHQGYRKGPSSLA